LGAFLLLVGVIVLGPVVAKPAAALLGAPVARLRGVTGRLAQRTRCGTEAHGQHVGRH